MFQLNPLVQFVIWIVFAAIIFGLVVALYVRLVPPAWQTWINHKAQWLWTNTPSGVKKFLAIVALIVITIVVINSWPSNSNVSNVQFDSLIEQNALALRPEPVQKPRQLNLKEYNHTARQLSQELIAQMDIQTYEGWNGYQAYKDEKRQNEPLEFELFEKMVKAQCPDEPFLFMRPMTRRSDNPLSLTIVYRGIPPGIRVPIVQILTDCPRELTPGQRREELPAIDTRWWALDAEVTATWFLPNGQPAEGLLWYYSLGPMDQVVSEDQVLSREIVGPSVTVNTEGPDSDLGFTAIHDGSIEGLIQGRATSMPLILDLHITVKPYERPLRYHSTLGL